MTIQTTEALLNKLIDIAWEASDAVLDIYQNNIDYSIKSDGSPLTQADLASHEIIVTKLHALTPEMPIISEESANLESIEGQNPHQFWLVDPLDGTKEFINRNGEFTINIALIEATQPVMGVVCAPALHTLYAGLKGKGAFKMDSAGHKKPITVLKTTKEGLYVVGSRSHGAPAAMDAYLANKKIARFIATGSSLKFCKIAEGTAHLYPRLGRTMEWDTAAGHAVLAAAGGSVEQLDGTPLYYGKKGFENPHFVAKAIS
ncbi:3'(2'),5'-bisphosphate nucleotidase CysQ [Legionella nagasakiensis]|uniref:3'(2'),5'-bisphosphate nucleotidase CysQ n=1 Tax=Legionella nagasakiensis TaxID=535290 RepID=UPI001054AB59|nr:3'(2'),5'-bisphosphate nucleotidase CysQ [Legionella nagasakiensis]